MKLITCCAILVLWSLVTCSAQTCNLKKAIGGIVSSAVSEAIGPLVDQIRKSSCNDPTSGKIQVPDVKCTLKDCADIALQGKNQSGVYKIWPQGWTTCGGVDVYCDLQTDGGGWTVIQRRGDFGKPKDYFYKRWLDYKKGFGDLSQDFWLGNEQIHHITTQESYVLRVEMKMVEGESKYAEYEEFYIEPESEKYQLRIFGYKGDAGDSMAVHNDMFFTTYDRDNDKAGGNCGVMHKGGWWYNACFHSNLNGLYLNGTHGSFADGINWFHWKGFHYSFKDVVMKIRPHSFRNRTVLNAIVPEASDVE